MPKDFSARYYPKTKKDFKKKLAKVIKYFLKNEQNKKRKYDWDGLKNLTEHGKKRLVEYNKK